MNKNKIYNLWFSTPALIFYLVLFILPVVLNFAYIFKYLVFSVVAETIPLSFFITFDLRQNHLAFP